MGSVFLLRGFRRPFTLKMTSNALPSFSDDLGRIKYSTEHPDDSRGVMEKARSTAEEFLRLAKEKSDSISDNAKEVVEDAKEAVLGETQKEKKKVKEKVEKEDYDKMSR